MLNNSEPAHRARDLPGLPALQPLPTAAERAASLIRDYIFEGKFLPGTPLPEASLAQALQVSRNTVREAYRTLMNEHLLAYEVHRGVTVRWLTAADVRDIYALRRLLELSAIDLISEGAAVLDAAALAAAVAAGEAAAAQGRWRDVGTANLRFHAVLVASTGSSRTDEFFLRLMTELRLGFLAVSDPESFHGSFHTRNKELGALLGSGRYADARSALTAYLEDAEGPVLAAVDAAARNPSTDS
jgi:DNA-binding GntR family transcriptional regulator